MKQIPLNKEAYSDSSKRSVGFEFLGEFYRDIHYQCKRCAKSEIFTAEDQKYTYEIKKKYMWQQRFLCNKCHAEMVTIKSELQKMEKYYCNNKEQSLKDREFLLKWLRLLKKYPTYWKKSNSSRVKFIEKALGLS